MSHLNQLSLDQKKFVIYLLLLSVGLTTMSTDIYIPSMPAMADFFETSKEAVQLSMPFVLFGSLCTTLIFGRLSDSIGRRLLVVIPLFSYAVLMLLSAMATSIEFFWFMRLLGGIAMSSSHGIVLAIISDMLPEKKADRYYAYFSLVMLVSLIFAPIIGGYYASIGIWQLAFLTLSFFGFVNAVLLYLYLPETLAKKKEFRLRSLFRDYMPILRNAQFLKYSMTAGIIIGIIVSYTINAAFYYINNIGMDVFTFSLHQLALMGTGAIVSYLLGGIMTRYDLEKINRFGLVAATIGGLIFTFFAVTQPGNAIALTGSMMIYALGVIFNMTSANPLIFRYFPNDRGSAASLAGFIRTGLMMLIIVSSSLIFQTLAIEIAVSICGFTGVAIILYFILNKR